MTPRGAVAARGAFGWVVREREKERTLLTKPCGGGRPPRAAYVAEGAARAPQPPARTGAGGRRPGGAQPSQPPQALVRAHLVGGRRMTGIGGKRSRLWAAAESQSLHGTGAQPRDGWRGSGAM